MTSKGPDYSRYSFLIGQLVRKLNLLNKDQKVCYGLTIPQCCTIETLGQKGKLSMNELSQELGTAVSTMTRVVDVLVRDGILERSRTPGDRRKVCIELTPKGKDLGQRLEKCSEDYSREILEEIPEGKRAQILEPLELLNQALESINNRKCCKV